MGDSNHQERARKKKFRRPSFLFDFVKPARDILGYKINDFFSVSTTYGTGLTITSCAGKIAKGSMAGVTAEYNQKDIHASVKVDVDSKLPISTTFTLSTISPTVKSTFSLKLPDNSSKKHLVPHEVEYIYKNAALSIRLPSISGRMLQLSATFGTPHLAFGMETVYTIASKRFCEINTGISVTKPNFDGSITLTKNGNFLRASYVHYFDHEKKVAAAAVISRKLSEKENVFVVGGTWITDDLTTIKARLDSRGKLVTLLHHKIKPRTYFTISSEFHPKALDRIPVVRFGLSLAL